MSFEWDQNKATRNLKKHRIDFADAVTVFDDFNTGTLNDLGHDKERFITIGMNAYGRILVVVYTWRGDYIRLISARKATKHERKQHQGWAMKNEYDFSKGKRFAIIPPDPNKLRITIRLYADIISYFKEQVHKGRWRKLSNND